MGIVNKHLLLTILFLPNFTSTPLDPSTIPKEAELCTFRITDLDDFQFDCRKILDTIIMIIVIVAVVYMKLFHVSPRDLS